MVTTSFINPPPGVKCIASLQDTIFAEAVTCNSDSGFSFWVFTAGPDPSEVTSICNSPTCRELIDNMRRVAPTECVMYMGFYLYADVLNPILKECTINGAWTITSPPGAAPAMAPQAISAPAAESNGMSTGTTIGIVGTVVIVLSILVWVVKKYRQHRRRIADREGGPMAELVEYRDVKD